MSVVRTGMLLAQGVVMYPVVTRFMLRHDPGLAAQPVEVRQRRLRSAPPMFTVLMLGAGVLFGDLPTMSFLWLMFLALGWAMKRHPGEIRQLAAGRRPSKVAVLDILLVIIAGGIALALGHAIG